MSERSRSPRILPAVLVLGGPLLTGSSCGDAAPTPEDALRDTFLGRAAEALDAAWLPQPPPMNPARARHSASLLPSGLVLLTGGRSTGGTRLASGQLYDPFTNGWAAPAPPSMSAARDDHTATTLLDGRVLVVGGYGSSVAVSTCEIYAPNAWTTVASLSPGRYRHTATLLEDGTVLVVGGQDTGDALQNLVSLYTPAPAPGLGTWSSRAPLSLARSLHTATRLNDGRVLVTGGLVGTLSTEDATIYDGPTNAWISAAPMSHVRQQHTATLLEDGDVLVVGWDPPYPQRYNPSSDTWMNTPAMNTDNTRFRHTATQLTNGCVLVAGGHYGRGGGPYTHLSDVELYDPRANLWTTTQPLTVPRSRHTATLLDDGVVMLAGGETDGGAFVDVVERYALGQDGDPCASRCECLSGFCADGVCCDSVCDAGACDACSVAAGAATDGTCALLTGNACDDGSGACTTGSICQAGVCVGGSPVVCPPPGECEESTSCDRATGECAAVLKPSGAACAGGVCVAGVCVPDSEPTSASASSGGVPAGHDIDDDGGCSCRAPGGARGAAVPPLSLLLLLLAARRRASPSRASPRPRCAGRATPR